LRTKCVGGDNVCPHLKVLTADVVQHVWAGKGYEFVVAFQLDGPICEQGATKVLLSQIVLLYHCAYGAIEYENAAVKGLC
jgi:hypothetical protein